MWCPERLKHNQTWHYTHWQWFFKKILHLTSWTSSSTSCACWEFCASLMNNSTTFSILKLGDPPWKTDFFFTGVWLDLGLWLVLHANSWFVFTFLSMQHKVNQLRVRTSGRTGSELPSWLRALGFCNILSCEMRSVPHANEQHETSKGLETDTGSELPPTSSNITHPGLASVKVDVFWQPTLHHDIRETETEQRETAESL